MKWRSTNCQIGASNYQRKINITLFLHRYYDIIDLYNTRYKLYNLYQHLQGGHPLRLAIIFLNTPVSKWSMYLYLKCITDSMAIVYENKSTNVEIFLGLPSWLSNSPTCCWYWRHDPFGKPLLCLVILIVILICN